MIVANVHFGELSQGDSEQLEDIAETYLVSLLRSGQLCHGDYFLYSSERCLNAQVLLAGRGALAPRYHSDWGKEILRKVITAFGKKPSWRMLDDKARLSPSTWRGAPFLYLFTHAFDRKPPVCRGDGKPPVPIYLLPLSSEQKDRLYCWQADYRHHDHLWLGCGALEIGAYRQLADPYSELADSGRKLCREIEVATGVPAFYYLIRYWGRPRGENQRKCPVCGGAWATGQDGASTRRFRPFEFKCERCRLVSHAGPSTDGGARVRIGEFSKEGKTTGLLAGPDHCRQGRVATPQFSRRNR